MSLRSVLALPALVLGLLVTAAVVAPRAAYAQPEKVFAGKILTSDKRFPTYAKSPKAYVAALKKQNKVNLQEDKAKSAWKIHYAAFFKKPVGDLEIAVKLYDVTQKQQYLLAAFEQFIDDRSQRSVISNFTLERKQVGVNKQILMQIEVKGRVIASGTFRILGEAEHFSGKADFSEEEAAGKDQ
jgi:hypothetical protein